MSLIKMDEISNEFVGQRAEEERLRFYREFYREFNEKVQRDNRIDKIANRVIASMSVALTLGLVYVLPAATGKGSFWENVKHQYNVVIPRNMGVSVPPNIDLSGITETERQKLNSYSPKDIDVRLNFNDVNSHQSKTWWHLAGVAA